MESGSPFCGESVASTVLALSTLTCRSNCPALAERLHVRNIDGAKQRHDLSCEGNTWHTFSLTVLPTTVVNLFVGFDEEYHKKNLPVVNSRALVDGR